MVSEELKTISINTQQSLGKSIADYNSSLIHQSTNTDDKYQDIEYCMLNRHKKVFYDAHAKTDFRKAIIELKGLDWTYAKNGISFINNKTDECFFCHRLGNEKWLVTTPIKSDGGWTGYEWVSYPNIDSIIYTLKLYFEENPWFHTLSWQRVKWTSDFGK